MKRHYYLIYYSIIAILTFSCNKETIKQNYDSFPNGAVLSVESVEQLMIGRDSKETQINKEMVALSARLLRYSKNSEFCSFIAETAKKNNGHVTLEQIHTKFPETKSVLIYNGNTNKSGVSTRSENECDIEYEGYLYKMIVYVPNFEACNPSQPPIMSAGLDADSNPNCDTCANLDEIFAWYLDSNNDTVNIDLGEAAGMSNIRPIWVTSLDYCGAVPNYLKKNNNPGYVDSSYIGNKKVNNRTVTKFVTNEFRISEKYETNKYSEFHISGIRVGPWGSPVAKIFEKPDGSAPDTRIKIADVHKNDVGADVSRWSRLTNDHIPRDQNAVFWNTYEHDWAYSEKSLGAGRYFAVIELWGKRKFFHEWYAFDPGATPITNQRLTTRFVPLVTVFNNWAFTFISEENKGYLRFWRVEI